MPKRTAPYGDTDEVLVNSLEQALQVEIEHAVDEIWNDECLVYNFLDYHFERDGAYCRARAYADTFDTVTLFGPFEGRKSGRKISNPGFVRDVMLYLERRFRTVSRG